MNKDEKANIRLIESKILDGEMFPINLYGRKVICKCKDAFIMIYNETEEITINSFKEMLCSLCNSEYRVAKEVIPSESATLLFLNPNPRFPMMMLASCKPKMIEILARASSQLLDKRPELIPIIQDKLNNLKKKSLEGKTRSEDARIK